MPWEIENGNRRIQVTIRMPDGDHTKEFDGNKTVKEVVGEVAREFSLKNVIVEASDGTEIEPEDGDRTVGEFGDLLIVAKTVAA